MSHNEHDFEIIDALELISLEELDFDSSDAQQQEQHHSTVMECEQLVEELIDHACAYSNPALLSTTAPLSMDPIACPYAKESGCTRKFLPIQIQDHLEGTSPHVATQTVPLPPPTVDLAEYASMKARLQELEERIQSEYLPKLQQFDRLTRILAEIHSLSTPATSVRPLLPTQIPTRSISTQTLASALASTFATSNSMQQQSPPQSKTPFGLQTPPQTPPRSQTHPERCDPERRVRSLVFPPPQKPIRHISWGESTPPALLDLYVATGMGSTLFLENVSPHETVWDLKKRVAQLLCHRQTLSYGVGQEEQRRPRHLVYRGLVLDDVKTLLSYQLPTGATIHVVLKF